MANNMNLTAPLPRLAMNPWNAFTLTAPVITLTMTDTYVSSGSMILAAPSVLVSIVTASGPMALETPAPYVILFGSDRWYEMEIRAPPPGLTINSTYTTGVLKITAPDPTISMSGGGDTMDSLSVRVPIPTVVMAAGGATSGTFDIDVPVPVIGIATGGIMEEGETVISTTRTHFCTVLNTDIWEVTEYKGWDFDQLVKFGDTYLAVNSTGIYALGGDTNDGTLIDAVVETGLDDFGTLVAKRASDLYVGWKSAEDGTITVIMDGKDEESFEYSLLATDGSPGAAKVYVGRPRQRKHISFKIENENGVDFDLYSIEVLLSTAIRKVQGMGE